MSACSYKENMQSCFFFFRLEVSDDKCEQTENKESISLSVKVVSEDFCHEDEGGGKEKSDESKYVQ